VAKLRLLADHEGGGEILDAISPAEPPPPCDIAAYEEAAE
jgi:hypothetical protein